MGSSSLRLMFRHAIVSITFLALYLLLTSPQVIFFSRIGLVAWYPAIGLATAVLLGISPWYALLACFADFAAGRFIYGQTLTSFSNTIGAVGLGFFYGAAAYVLRRFVRIDLMLRRRGDVLRYCSVNAVAAGAATLRGVGCLIADGQARWSEFGPTARMWFMGDAIGLVGIAPFLLVHVLPHVRRWLSPAAGDDQGVDSLPVPSRTLFFKNARELLAQTLAILAVVWVMFDGAEAPYEHFYFSFIPIIWMAIRQGIGRVVTGLLVFNFGIVVAMHLYPPTLAQFSKVGLLMFVLSTVGLAVGSEVTERQRLASDLDKEATFLDSLIQNSPLGIVVLNRDGSVELANSAFRQMFPHDAEQLGAAEVAATCAPDHEGAAYEQTVSEIFSGHPVHTTVRKRRKDGRTLDLDIHGLPLLVSGKIQGAYLIYQDVSEQTKAREAEQSHARSLNRLVKELELRASQRTWLNEMASLLACSTTLKETCDIAGKFMRKLFPEADAAAVYLFRPSRDLLEGTVFWSTNEELVPTFVPNDCWSVRRGQSHWSMAGVDIGCQHLDKSRSPASLCVPMVAQGNTLGVLHVEFQDVADRRRDSDQESSRRDWERLAVSAASQIASSIANLQLYDVLREQAIRDPLTRLFNRRFLEESLQRELDLAGRKNQSVAVIFLDVDHFKKFNDSFGHDAGDMMLQTLGDLFRKFFRATDICCRYGGEEFVIVLPESSSHDAALRAEGLRLEVKQLRFQYRKQTLGGLTVSAGIAAFPEQGSNATELLKIADECLYQSKMAGRDTVTVAAMQNAN